MSADEAKKRLELNDIVGLQQAAGVMLTLANTINTHANNFASISNKHAKWMGTYPPYLTVRLPNDQGDYVVTAIYHGHLLEKIKQMVLETMTTDMIRERQLLADAIARAAV